MLQTHKVFLCITIPDTLLNIPSEYRDVLLIGKRDQGLKLLINWPKALHISKGDLTCLNLRQELAQELRVTSIVYTIDRDQITMIVLTESWCNTLITIEGLFELAEIGYQTQPGIYLRQLIAAADLPTSFEEWKTRQKNPSGKLTPEMRKALRMHPTDFFYEGTRLEIRTQFFIDRSLAACSKPKYME